MDKKSEEKGTGTNCLNRLMDAKMAKAKNLSGLLKAYIREMMVFRI
jgi:hypothetical protein